MFDLFFKSYGCLRNSYVSLYHADVDALVHYIIDTITGILIIMLGYTYISQQYYRVP
jgi:hypothetical protein